ncbi:MAG: GTP-binding protein [Candidatus Heimdallarchaeota archaeon]
MIDFKNLIPIHIGLYGHIDSGKTALAAVLSEIISTAGIDAHPQSKERGITIDLGFTSFVLDKYIITLVDGPGHADLIRISASSVEIIDCAIIVIDINKGPQIQTGEHIIMIESLNIKDVIVVLNKTDIFNGDINHEIKKTRAFFQSTSFGSKVPIFAVSAKKVIGFQELKEGILDKVKGLKIQREFEGDIIIPIDHHFSIKGRGTIITGTILQGKIGLNQTIYIMPVGFSGKVKSIQIFHQTVNNAKAGDRVGINIKGIDAKNVFRGCYATDNKDAFEYSDIIEVEVKKNKIFKAETHFGTQVHITIGMFTSTGYIYPFIESNGKKIQMNATNDFITFKAFLCFNENILFRKEKATILLSRLDLPPTTLRVLGSAKLIKTFKESPIIYRYKVKKGIIQNPSHSQGIICTGLAQSLTGAKKIVGRRLEKPFTKIISPFGTKGAVIVGLENSQIIVKKGDYVILRELRSYRLKSKKDLNSQN